IEPGMVEGIKGDLQRYGFTKDLLKIHQAGSYAVISANTIEAEG
ncbi:unnamed protein product, partial [marine sediment metagenome]